MSNGIIYVVDAHFLDKIEEKKKSWTQVPVVSSFDETDRHDITEILLKVLLSTITLTMVFFYMVQITTNFEKIILKFVVFSISLARTDTILNVVREITRL